MSRYFEALMKQSRKAVCYIYVRCNFATAWQPIILFNERVILLYQHEDFSHP